MVISLVYPTRSRPEKSLQNIYRWIVKSGMVNLELIISVDTNDPRVSDYTSDSYKEKVHQHGIKYNVIVNPNNSVVEATNNACREAAGDILIYLSDDFNCPDQWGSLILKEFAKYGGPTLIKVSDKLQPNTARVLTIPMMNRELYNKLGYFFHPEYKSMWCDVDLFETCFRIGAIKNAFDLVFPHEHHSIGKAENDETYRNSEKNWDQGLAIFNKRKKLNFPI